MGIRCYAYAFEKDQTDQALADPRAFISSDPLADAWGFEPHAVMATATFEQSVPARDMLYLDKAWPFLQRLTGSTSAVGSWRPAFRMFEGEVTSCDHGWIPWYRALAPAEVAEVADDLAVLDDDFAATCLRNLGTAEDMVGSTLGFLGRARVFVEGLVADERGMAYMIG